MKLTLVFLLLCITGCVYALDEPFNGFNVKQCVTGTADLNVVMPGAGVVGGIDLPNAAYGLGAPILAIDPENKQFVFLNQQSAQYTLANGTYTVSLDPVTLNQFYCFYDAKQTYDYEVLAHTNLINIGRLGVVDTFFGRAKDVGSCEATTSFLVRTDRLGKIRQLTFSQGYPTPIESTSSPLTATGTFIYSDNCPTEGSEFSNLFGLPPICWEQNLPEWCSTFKFN